MGLPRRRRRQQVHGVVGKEVDAKVGYEGRKRSAVLSAPGWLCNDINSNTAQCGPDIDCWFSVLAFLILPTDVRSNVMYDYEQKRSTKD